MVARKVSQPNSISVSGSVLCPLNGARFAHILIAVRHHLFKYFTELRWAEAFLRGELLFRSLAYFRDFEDQDVRRDSNEGSAVMHPASGLHMYNQTQRKEILLPNGAFISTVKQEEVFVLCATRSMTDERKSRFNAVACVEIRSIPKLCARIELALPQGAKFFAGRVEYYQQTEEGSPRWALPDMIARAKLKSYEWQDEYRFLFSTTDALDFEKAQYQIVTGKREPPDKPTEYPSHLLKTRDLKDFCLLHIL
jgi:hypothetical protein